MMSKEKRRVPKLRFPGFTEDWEQRKLSDISTKVTTKNADVHYTETLTNSAEQGIISQVDFFDKEISNKDNINGYYIVENNDFIYNPRISTLAPVGPINRNKLNRTGIMSPLYTVFRASNVDLGFLEWYFQSNHWHRYMKLNGDSGARADRIAIKDSTFFEMPIKTPVNIKEQVLIGETLEKFNQYITLHQRKLDNFKLKKKALLQKLFPKNGERYPELRFPGFTDAWEQRKLGDIATFSKGNGYSKSDLAPSGNPIILYGRLYTNYETTISNVDTFVELKDKSVLSQGGEVIVPASGETAEDISRASVVKNQGIIIGGDLNVIKANHLLNPTFLALTISNGGQQKELSKRAQGKSVVHLHNSDLQEVNLIFPLLNEQKEISTLFEKMDNIITLHQRKLDHLQLQKKALLQQMFV